MSVGKRIYTAISRIAPSTIERFRSLPVANVSDSMARLNSAGVALRPMHSGSKLAGSALTVKTRPGDNLLIHKAIDVAQPGDVIVVDGGGDLTNALFGELMLAHATVRGIAGFVIHGAIRDADILRIQDVPVFAAGITHRGPYRDGPGEIGYPIAINGMVVAPGDLVLGDGDGVLAVPAMEIEAVLAAAVQKRDVEHRQMAETRGGTLDRSWVDKALSTAGFTCTR